MPAQWVCASRAVGCGRSPTGVGRRSSAVAAPTLMCSSCATRSTVCGPPSGRLAWLLRRPAALLPWERAQRQFDARSLRGPATLTGARQVLLLPPFRADFRTAPRVRHGGDPRLRRAEVRVPELLLSADDPRRLLRRPAGLCAGWGAPPRPRCASPERAGPRRAA